MNKLTRLFIVASVFSVTAEKLLPFQSTIEHKHRITPPTTCKQLLSRSNTGNTFRIHRVLNRRRPLKVLVLGGSLTHGADVGGKKHAWPSFLAVHLADGLPIMQISNRAKGSTGSNYALANLDKLIKPYDWDLIFLEYALNDDDVGGHHRYLSGTEVTKTFEHLIRNIRTSMPTSAIVIMEVFRQSKKPRLGFTSGQNYHDIISKYYELPVISIREAVWHDYFEDVYIRNITSALAKSFPPGKSHPSVDGQRLISQLIRKELILFKTDTPTYNRDRLELFPPLMLSNAEAKQHPIITHWLHHYEFEKDVRSQKGIINSIGWNFVVQKSKGGQKKPGLLCKNIFPNQLTVTIDKCTKLIQIGYLKSYSSFGKAIVRFLPNAPLELESRWDHSQGSGIFTQEIDLDRVKPTFN